MKKATLLVIMIAISLNMRAPSLSWSQFLFIQEKTLANFLIDIKSVETWHDSLNYKKGNPWKKINQIGALGAYQFMPSTLRFLGYKGTIQYFLNHPKTQTKYMLRLIEFNKRILAKKSYTYKVTPIDSIGKKIYNVQISLSGLIAISHLGGAGSAQRIIAKKGIAIDSNGTTVLMYMDKFKNYNMDTSNIQRYLLAGEDHKDWYETESKKLLSLLPEFEGLPIIRTFAVTSMTTSIEANVHLALKALLQMKRGECIKGFLPAQEKYLNLISQRKDVPGRKIMNFIKALEGDSNAVVVDIWMCKAFGELYARTLPSGRAYYRSPSKKEYDMIESFVLYDAHKRCIEPRQYQSMVWAGIKREQSIVSKNVTWSDLLIKKRGLFSYEV